jgi:cholesterol transport system auxiliary component
MTHSISQQLARRRALLLMSAPIMLGACGVVPEVNKPLTLYSLSPSVAPLANPPPLDWQLVVATPNASADINTNRIALSRAANRIEYFADGVWADAAPVLVQAKLIEAFEAAVPSLPVGRDASGLRPDFILQLDLRGFQAEYQGGSAVAVVRIAARLVKMPERRIMGSVVTESRQPAGAGGLPGVIAAFEAALGQAFNELIPGILAAANS